MDETNLDADSQDKNHPLRVAIAYNDIATGKRAMRVLADLGKGLGEAVEFQPLPWSFDLLADADGRGAAARDGVNADILMVATSSTNPPPPAIGRWAEAPITLRKSARHYAELLAQSRRQQEQLRHLSHQLLSTQEEERKKISRELHDVIAQTLASINVRLGALKEEATTNTKDLRKKISSTQRLVGKSVDIVHRFARELRSTVLDDLGLIPALDSFVKSLAKRTGLHIHLKVFAAVEELDNDKRTVLYRVAQEALTNVARHAQASRVEVSIQKLPAAVRMEIKDDGKSFQVRRVLDVRRSHRLGLLGMRERVEMVGGSFSVESAPGKGTTVLAKIPLANGGVREGKPVDGIR